MNSHIREAVQDSQLVTINVGSNDILTFPFTYTIELLYRTDDSKLTAFMKKLMKCDDYPEMLDTFFQTANTLNNVQEMLTKMLSLAHLFPTTPHSHPWRLGPTSASSQLV